MNPYLQEILHNITTRLAKLEEAPSSLLDSVHCQCGASWKYKDGELDYKPSTKKKEWVGLTDEERIQVLHSGDKEGYLEYAKGIEAKLKEKNSE
jgi:predicted metal-dependent hydrolase